MGKILSLKEYYENKLVEQVLIIKAHIHERLERIEKLNEKLQKDIETLITENKVLRGVIKEYEKESQVKRYSRRN